MSHNTRVRLFEPMPPVVPYLSALKVLYKSTFTFTLPYLVSYIRCYLTEMPLRPWLWVGPRWGI